MAEGERRPLLIERPIVVRTYDIDFANIVHNIVYFRWLEDLRSEILADVLPIVLDQPWTLYAPSGESVTIAYDQEGANTLTAGGTTLIDAIGYNERGQLTLLSRANGAPDTTLLYHGAGSNFRLNKILHGGEGGTLPDFIYGATQYDPAGNLLGMQMKVNAATESYSFGYDALNRLTTANLTGAGTANYSYTYSYNELGNITSRTGTDPDLLTYGYGDRAASGQIPAMTGGPQAVTYVDVSGTANDWRYDYDARGNLDGKYAGTTLTHDYTFDVEGRLASVRTNNETTTFFYDADGQRVMTARPASDGTVVYTPFPDYEREVTAGGAVRERTTYSVAGQMVAVRSAGALYYTYGDHLGSVVAMSNTAGVITANSLTHYDPFGNYRTWPGSNVNPLISDRGFTGHVHDNTGAYPTQNLGLIYMNARYYLPEIGRFISPDSIVPEPANPQSYNRFAYAGNRPINFTDPTGHKECGSQSDCGNPLSRWQSAIVVQSSNVIVSQLPVPVDAMPSDWRSFPANYAQLFPLVALRPTAPSGSIFIYYGFGTTDISSLLDFQIIAHVLLSENLRLFLFRDPRYAQEVREHWPQDAIAMNFIIIRNAARSHQTVAEYVGPNQTADPLFDLSKSAFSALDLAYAVALGVDQGWLDDPSFGADWYYQQVKNSADGYLDNTRTGDWAAGTHWEPSFSLGRIVDPFEKWSASPSPYQ